jgi:hypothetical protein
LFWQLVCALVERPTQIIERANARHALADRGNIVALE